MPAKPRKVPKPTVLRDFFGSLDDKTKGLLFLTLNLEADSELSQNGGLRSGLLRHRQPIMA